MTELTPHYHADSAAFSPPVNSHKPDLGNIGIFGAHGTGKTTLANALSTRLGLPFIEIGTSAIFAEHRIDPAKPMDFRTRLGIQRKILNHASNIWFEVDEPFICNRTPLDMIAYTLADVRGSTLTEETEWELADYIRDCHKATVGYFDKLILLPPVLPVSKNRAGKASSSKGYREHIHTLCLGLFHDSHVNGYTVDKDVQVLESRVADVVRWLNV